MRKLIPLLIVVVAGCGSTGRNFFSCKQSNPTCGDPCAAPSAPAPACNSGCNSAPAETMLNEYPMSTGTVTGTPMTGTPIYTE